MAVIYLYGIVSVVCIIGIIWARHELKSQELNQAQ